jgi:signal transduction histidine kinase
LFFIKNQNQRLREAKTMEKNEKGIFEKKNPKVGHNCSCKMTAVGRLAGGMAHRLNNCLQIVDYRLELLIMDHPKLGAEVKEILGESHRMAKLIEQLLQISQRTMIWKSEPVGIGEVITNSIKKLESMGVKGEFRCAINNSIVKISVPEMENVLAGMLLNSWEAINNNGQERDLKVSIEAQEVVLSAKNALSKDIQPGKFVEIKIKDNGPGIPSEIQPLIFEPFFSTKSSHLGAGLGLSVAYGIVKRSQGAIEVAESDDSGTTFAIYLPAAS